MKKGKETATLEPVKEVKSFTATYQHYYKEQYWPVEVRFTNELVNNPPGRDLLNGFYYVDGGKLYGSSMAADDFQNVVLNTYTGRKEFNKWIEDQMELQKNN